MIFNREAIINKYPWINERNHKFIISSDYDGIICGDDYYTHNVLKKGKLGKLKVFCCKGYQKPTERGAKRTPIQLLLPKT